MRHGSLENALPHAWTFAALRRRGPHSLAATATDCATLAPEVTTCLQLAWWLAVEAAREVTGGPCPKEPLYLKLAPLARRLKAQLL